jgi:hypothetical protein
MERVSLRSIGHEFFSVGMEASCGPQLASVNAVGHRTLGDKSSSGNVRKLSRESLAIELKEMP